MLRKVTQILVPHIFPCHSKFCTFSFSMHSGKQTETSPLFIGSRYLLLLSPLPSQAGSTCTHKSSCSCIMAALTLNVWSISSQRVNNEARSSQRINLSQILTPAYIGSLYMSTLMLAVVIVSSLFAPWQDHPRSAFYDADFLSYENWKHICLIIIYWRYISEFYVKVKAGHEKLPGFVCITNRAAWLYNIYLPACLSLKQFPWSRCVFFVAAISSQGFFKQTRKVKQTTMHDKKLFFASIYFYSK